MCVRLCKVFVILISEKTCEDQMCSNQIMLAIKEGKPIIPLLVDSNLKWSPSDLLNKYQYIRFDQTIHVPNYWLFDNLEKFEELTFQILKMIEFNGRETPIDNDTTAVENETEMPKPKYADVFISYHWANQKDVLALYDKLKSLKITTWLDIYEKSDFNSYDKRSLDLKRIEGTLYPKTS